MSRCCATSSRTRSPRPGCISWRGIRAHDMRAPGCSPATLARQKTPRPDQRPWRSAPCSSLDGELGDGAHEVTIDQGVEMGRPVASDCHVRRGGWGCYRLRVTGGVVKVAEGQHRRSRRCDVSVYDASWWPAPRGTASW